MPCRVSCQGPQSSQAGRKACQAGADSRLGHGGEGNLRPGQVDTLVVRQLCGVARDAHHPPLLGNDLDDLQIQQAVICT